MTATAIATWSFVVPGIPVAKARHRARVVMVKGGKPFAHLYQPENGETARFEERVRLFAREAGVTIANEGALQLVVIAYWPMKGTPLKRGSRPERMKATKPDCDNILKSVGDALNGVAYKDDAQVARAEIEKRHCAQDDPEGARVVVTIGPIEEIES